MDRAHPIPRNASVRQSGHAQRRALPTHLRSAGWIWILALAGLFLAAIPAPVDGENASTVLHDPLLAGGGEARQQPRAARPTAPAARARLTLSANAPQASIYLNGAFRGKTDEEGRLVIEQLPPGRYILRARKIGYDEYRFEFRAAAGQTQRLRVTLRPTSDSAELAFQRGEQLREDKKFEASIPEYEEALKHRPKFPAARLGLARSLLALNRHEEARQHAEEAIKSQPGQNPEAHTVLGNILRGAGLYEEAGDAYRRALQLTRNFSPEAHAGLALTLDDMGEPEEAIKHMRQAIAQDGDAEPILYNLLGNMLLFIEAKREALQAFETYLKLAPDSNLASAIRSLAEQLREELATEP